MAICSLHWTAEGDTPAVATSISNHLAAGGPALHTGYIAHVGYARYPYAAHLIGKRDVDCGAEVAIFITRKATVTSVGHLTTYANGAVSQPIAHLMLLASEL